MPAMQALSAVPPRPASLATAPSPHLGSRHQRQDLGRASRCPLGYLQAGVRGIFLPATQLFVVIIESILRRGVGNLTSRTTMMP